MKTTPSSHDGVAVPRSSRLEVLDVVRSDLEFASKYLPETNSDGFPTKWTAEAYLGKLYHTLGCLGDATAWEKAKTYFEGVKGKYDLESKFSNLFVDKIKGSKESIFQLGFQVNGELSSRVHLPNILQGYNKTRHARNEPLQPFRLYPPKKYFLRWL